MKKHTLRSLVLEKSGGFRGRSCGLRSLLVALSMIATPPHCAAQSGGGSSGSPRPVQRSGSAASLIYPGAAQTATMLAAQSNKIPLRKPNSLDAAGIYVWKDGDGSWSLGLIASSDRIVFSGEFTSPATIIIDAEQNDGGVLRAVNPNRVRLNFVAVGKVTRFVGFRTDADYIDFDLHVNGAEDPASIFVGNKKLSPGRTSFRVAEQASGESPTQTGSPTQQTGSPSQVNSGAGNGGGPGQRRPSTP